MQLKVSVTEGVFILNPEDIICLEANSNYTKLYLTDKRNLFSAKTLKAYQSMLPPNYFYRVHSSFLINKNHICKICPQGLALSQNIHVPVARRRRTRLWSILKENGHVMDSN